MGKKKGGKEKGKEDEGELGAKEQLRLLFVENQSLKRQLADRRNDAMSGIARKKALEAQVADLKRDFEREEKATFSITADMTRQYKDMQEDLIKRINEAENTITELRDQLELQGLAYEDLKKEKDRAIAIKEAEAALLPVGGTHGAAVREAASEFRVKVSSTRPISSMCGLARSAAASGRRVVPVRPLG